MPDVRCAIRIAANRKAHREAAEQGPPGHVYLVTELRGAFRNNRRSSDSRLAWCFCWTAPALACIRLLPLELFMVDPTPPLPHFAEVSERLAKNTAELLKAVQCLECPQPENASAEAMMCLQMALGVVFTRAGLHPDLSLPASQVLPGVGVGMEMETTRKNSFLQ